MSIRFFVFYITLPVILMMHSCMLCSRMDKLVSQHYAQTRALKPVEDKNNVHFDMSKLPRVPGFCRSRYKSFFTIPLLFYNFSKEKIYCQVNPRIYVRYLSEEYYRLTQADSSLKGRLAELHFNEISSTFTHFYKESYVMAGYFSFAVKDEHCLFENGLIVVSLELKDQGGNTVKKTTVEQKIPYFDNRRSGSQWRKGFIKDFVSTFDTNVQDACRQMAQKLADETKNL